MSTITVTFHFAGVKPPAEELVRLKRKWRSILRRAELEHEARLIDPLVPLYAKHIHGRTFQLSFALL